VRLPIVLSATLLSAATWSGVALAQSGTAWTYEHCIETHDACIAGCRAEHDDGKGGAGCIAACATQEMQCVTGEAASEVTPWLERKKEELEDFLDDFLRDLPNGEGQEPPGPSGDNGITT